MDEYAGDTSKLVGDIRKLESFRDSMINVNSAIQNLESCNVRLNLVTNIASLANMCNFLADEIDDQIREMKEDV